MHREFGGIYNTNQVYVDHFEVGLLGLIGLFWFWGSAYLHWFPTDGCRLRTYLGEGIKSTDSSVCDYDVDALLWGVRLCRFKRGELFGPDADIAFTELIAKIKSN
jgi:hypothetical protein